METVMVLWVYVSFSAVVTCVMMAVKPPEQWQKPQYDWMDRVVFALLAILLMPILAFYFWWDMWKESRR